MKPISKFPYEVAGRTENHPMHKRMLLLKLSNDNRLKYAIGYYDAIDDVFKTSMTGHQPTGCYWDEMPAKGNESEHKRFNGRSILDNPYTQYMCVMPSNYVISKGPHCFTHYISMDEVLDLIRTQNLICWDVDEILGNNPVWSAPYLIITKDNRIFIADIGNFVEPIGTQFSAFKAPEDREHGYCANAAVPREIIRYVINLKELEATNSG